MTEVIKNSIKLYEGDCLEKLKLIPDGSIDLILTDPPYGTTACNWDSVIPLDLMWAELYRVIRPNGFIVLFGSQPFTTKLIASNIENFSHQWIWKKEQGSNPLLANKIPMKNFEDVIVFTKSFTKNDLEGLHPLKPYFKSIYNYINKSHLDINKALNNKMSAIYFTHPTQFSVPTQVNYNKLIEIFKIDKMQGFKEWQHLKEVDKVYRKELSNYFNKKYPRIYNPIMTEGTIYKSGTGNFKTLDKVIEGGSVSNKRYPKSIIEFNTNKRHNIHPTQKPTDLLEYLIKTYTNENNTVLDFTVGSGSTCIAAMNTKRNCIGIELDNNYFNVSSKRIEDHNKTLDNKYTITKHEKE